MRSDGVNEPNEKVTNEVLFERQEHFSRNYVSSVDTFHMCVCVCVCACI